MNTFIHRALICSLGALALLFHSGGESAAGVIAPDLVDVLTGTSEGENVSVLVVLDDRVDIGALNLELNRMHATREYRHERVVRELKGKADATQGDLLSLLESGVASGKVLTYSSLWIANMIRLEATRRFIEQAAARSDVAEIYLNYEIEAVEPVSSIPSSGRDRSNVEQGLYRINAPLAWERGYTGAGRLVSHLDTGADGNHVAFASRWRGLHAPASECWYDPVTHTSFPFDSGIHGTHTMGTMCGYDPATDDHIGVAWAAEWISAGVIDRVDTPTTIADAITAWQWIADPDGDPGTVDDVPDVNSNSWGISPIWHGQYLPQGPCDPMFWGALDACEAAGVVVVFAAGNEGDSAPNAIRNPGNRAADPYNSFCVGAITGSDYGPYPIATFSSRGPAPTDCGNWTTKPEVSAPGVDVRSSLPGNTYGNMSGTSMATPHVAGAVAILREVDPNASSDYIKGLLMASAYDLGASGEDNGYGWGLIDLQAALNLMGAGGCWWELTCAPTNSPTLIPEEGGTFSFDASLTSHCDTTRTTDVWSMVRLPDGSRYGPVLLYTDILFKPDQTIGVTGMTHKVPGGAPQGHYEYTIYYGDYPSTPADSCMFPFWKQSGQGGGGGYSTLILLSDYSLDEAFPAQDAILTDSRFTGADASDVRHFNPQLDELLPYDVILVWSNYPFRNTDLLGDVLADYVDTGGAVVLAQYCFTDTLWSIGGRMMSQYSPMGTGSTLLGGTLGTYDPTHPIMQGVTSLTAQNGTVVAPTQGNSDLVASWNYGNPCVVVNTDVPRVVALNMYFGASYSTLSGDWNVLLPNAMAFAGDNSLMRLTAWRENDFIR